MEQIMIPILIVILTAIVVIILDLTGQIRIRRIFTNYKAQDSNSRAEFPIMCEVGSSQINEPSELHDPEVLNCRVKLTRQKEADCAFDAFTVQIGGIIRAPSDMHYTTLQILLTDVTDEAYDAKPVHSRMKQWP